ncbi:MAG: peptide chain release factor 2 [bacterium]|nr:peptide chain release factor 2 [bacterium]
MRLAKKLKPCGGTFDVAGCQKRAGELEAVMAQSAFWDKPDAAQTTIQENKALQQKLDTWQGLERQFEDVQVLTELAEEEKDESMLPEIASLAEAVEKSIEDIEFRQMLSGPHDKSNAILSINAGAGGTEAQDWADMLLRMFTRWSERQKFKTRFIDVLHDQEAGIKSATITISGEYAFGYLKSEVGVHRLVRISPFDTGKRRHTSFASIMVIPEIEDDIDIEINEEDLRVDTYRASGAGGQHVNKTDSAVRITHVPTGIVVQCQNERSQHKNRTQAMKILRARLYEQHMEEQDQEMEKLQGEKRVIAWGSQIRSYVLHPYQMVKDHRTNYESSNVTAILDGDIDEFMRKYLMFISQS